MPKAMIITVGAQGEQIVFSIKENKPKFLGFLITKTPECENAVNEVIKKVEIRPTDYKINEFEDNPKEIGSLINKFYEIYKWLTETKGLQPEEILVDITGGRKWMSAGLTMISSFLGLNMIYVDAKFKEGRPDPSTMRIIQVGNAYEQAGFIEESKADKLFNEYSFQPAIEIYDLLSRKISDPVKVETVEIKKCIAQAYLFWTQFKFEEAYNSLKLALEKINQFHILEKLKERIQKQISLISILKRNDEKQNNQPRYSYFQLLQQDDFSINTLLFLYSLQSRYVEKGEFEQAVIVLYRILEFIAQYCLAKHNIDTNNITTEIQQRYNQDFKKITKDVFAAEREIPDKTGLIESWVLLYCVRDGLVEKDSPESLKGLRKNTEPRNLLWIEHKNESVDETKYNSFKRYVEMWLIKILPDFHKDTKDFEFIKL